MESTTTQQYIYKFRSLNIDQKTGEPYLYDELKENYLFFATPEELNDPMDSYKNVYWEGDNVLWANLFKHYILCFESAFAFAIIGKPISKSDDIPVFITKDEYQEPDLTMINNIINDLFKRFNLSNFADTIPKNKSKIKKRELLCVLRMMHFEVIKTIQKEYLGKGYIKLPLIPERKADIKFDFFKSLLKNPKYGTYTQHNKWTEFITEFFNKLYEQAYIASELNNTVKPKEWKFLVFDFPEAYIKSIEKLMFPTEYISCFSEDYKNTIMWSHYASSHKGVCLIFKPEQQNNLILNYCTGYHCDKDGSNEIWKYSPVPIKRIKYINSKIPFNFFQFMGVNTKKKCEDWFIYENNISKYEMYEGLTENEWRLKYWNGIQDAIITKYPAWKYEKELRLTLNAPFGDPYSLPEKRKIKYDFRQLYGVIFGVRTDYYTKLRITKIVHEKCQNDKTHKINFYQAKFDKRGNVIISQDELFTIGSK